MRPPQACADAVHAPADVPGGLQQCV